MPRRPSDGADRLLPYALLALSAAGLGFVQTLVFSKILGVGQLGYYSVAMAVASYLFLLQFGILSGLNRELPLLLGAGATERAARLIGQATAALFFVMAVILGTALGLARGLDLPDAGMRLALVLGGLLAAGNVLFQLGILRLRCERRATTFAGILLAQKMVILLVGALVGYAWGFAGLLVIMAAVNLILFLFVSIRYLNPAPLRAFSSGDLLSLVRVGLPIMSAGAFADVRLNMDRVFLVGRFTPEEIGLYHFGALPLSLGAVLNGVVSQYLTPKLLHEFGRHGSVGRVFKATAAVAASMTALLVLSFPLVVAAVRFGVLRLFPEYAASLPLLTVFSLGGILAVGNIGGVVILAAGRQMLDAILTALEAGLMLLAFVVAARLNLPLQWFAGLAVLGVAAESGARMALAWWCARRGQREQRS